MLEIVWEKKKIMTECVVNTLNHIMAQILNANIIRNTGVFLSRHEKEVPVDWIGKSKLCIPSEKFKTSY